ncbi:hypothetical protein K458DRAFT_386968 [Lentithecium fluviatile CBS 122367]|uniref:Uncharacterized protein n=1 Tax=Lentithecium fluviatile CBS 122367 TaxID=1168545 RepID=A0A6G1JA41_9PLEO|nr:hypothetical protein K458DRAFT_386968 [Lentithecium fluviatile CBS 122367]
MLHQNFQQWPFICGCPLPQDLVSVIIAVRKVASGQLESMHVSSYAAIEWIGAIAEWLFTSELFYMTPQINLLRSTLISPKTKTQVHLTFDRDPSTAVSQSRLHVVLKSYHLSNNISLFWQNDRNQVKRLRKMTLNLGTALGCAARIFKAIVKAEHGVPERYLRECRGYFDAPQAMDKACRLSFDAAKGGDFDHSEEVKGFCLILIMETIIVLCQVTAGLTVAENLHPMRCRLEVFYNRQLQVHGRDKDEDDQGDLSVQESLRTFGPIVYVLFTNGFVDLTLEQEAEADKGRLVAAIKLFIGRYTRTHAIASAVSNSGICAYLDILRDISIVPESAGRVHVMPGTIERDHKPFPQVQDNDIELMHHTGSVIELSAALAELNDVILEVTETAHSLSVNFLFQRHGDDVRDDSRSYLRVGPGDIVHRVHRARGLVHCSAHNRSCKRRRMGPVSCDRAQYPILKLTTDAEIVEVCDTTKDGEYFRVVALRVATAKNPFYFCVLTDEECVDCCLAVVVNHDIRLALIIANVGNVNWTNTT